MPNKNIHMFFDKHVLGLEKTNTEPIHDWIDEPVKDLGFQHRSERHDSSAIIYCGKRWGNTAMKVALLHLIVDTDLNCELGVRYFDNDVEKIKVDEKIRNFCDHYAERLFDFYTGNLRTYQAKVIYSNIISESKEILSKELRQKIKDLTSHSKRFIFYSDEYTTEIMANKIQESHMKLIKEIEAGNISLLTRDFIWDFKRKLIELIPAYDFLLATCNLNTYDEIRKTPFDIKSIVSLTVEGKFAAAHSISSFPKGHKCNNIHGHEWKYKCKFFFTKSETTKISEDFGKVKNILRTKVEDILDHSNLDNRFEVASAEEISKWIFEQVSEEYEELMSVTVKETETSWVTYDQDSLCSRYEEIFKKDILTLKKVGQLDFNDFNECEKSFAEATG